LIKGLAAVDQAKETTCHIDNGDVVRIMTKEGPGSDSAVR